VNPGDVLIFYVTSPFAYVVGVYKATSSMFEEKRLEPWTRRFPYRIKIEAINCIKELSNQLPFNPKERKKILQKELVLTQGIRMVELSKKQLNLILNAIMKINPNIKF